MIFWLLTERLHKVCACFYKNQKQELVLKWSTWIFLFDPCKNLYFYLFFASFTTNAQWQLVKHVQPLIHDHVSTESNGMMGSVLPLQMILFNLFSPHIFTNKFDIDIMYRLIKFLVPLMYCQAQPQPQLQLSWAELALISAKTLTTNPPPTHPGK